MTREEVFVPATRSEKLGAEGKASPKKVKVDGEWWDELLEDAPIYRLGKIVLQQVSLCLSGGAEARRTFAGLFTLTATRMASLPSHQRYESTLVSRWYQP
jgi:hypothetical protein